MKKKKKEKKKKNLVKMCRFHIDFVFIIAVVDVDPNKNISPALRCIRLNRETQNRVIYNPNGISNEIMWLCGCVAVFVVFYSEMVHSYYIRP